VVEDRPDNALIDNDSASRGGVSPQCSMNGLPSFVRGLGRAE